MCVQALPLSMFLSLCTRVLLCAHVNVDFVSELANSWAQLKCAPGPSSARGGYIPVEMATPPTSGGEYISVETATPPTSGETVDHLDHRDSECSRTATAHMPTLLLEQAPESGLKQAWPKHVRSQFLDCRTALDFTPFLLACKCGHAKVAEVLRENACNTALVNSSGLAGTDLMAEYEREVKLSSVQPWNRGDLLHCATKTPAQFLGMVKAELSEHVRAGMKV